MVEIASVCGVVLIIWGWYPSYLWMRRGFHNALVQRLDTFTNLCSWTNTMADYSILEVDVLVATVLGGIAASWVEWIYLFCATWTELNSTELNRTPDLISEHSTWSERISQTYNKLKFPSSSLDRLRALCNSVEYSYSVRSKTKIDGYRGGRIVHEDSKHLGHYHITINLSLNIEYS